MKKDKCKDFGSIFIYLNIFLIILFLTKFSGFF